MRLALVVLGAAFAMVLSSASLAAAEPTTLCENDEGVCEEPSTVHFATVGKAKLLVPGLTVECDGLVSGEVLSGLASEGPVTIHVPTASLVYSSCSGGCTVTTKEGGLVLVSRTNTELAQVTGQGFEVKVVCLGMINCTYNPEGLTGHGLGALPATGNGDVTYTEAPVKGTGLLCPESKLDAVFESLTPLYIRE